MFAAAWNGAELARSDDVIEVEGRLYFLAGDVREERLRPAPDRSVCEWKGGEAEYFDIVVDGKVNRAAAWHYPRLGETARPLVGRIAFWKDVTVGWDLPGPAPVPPAIEARTPNVAKALGSADIVWRPSAAPLPRQGNAEDAFAGYLIPSRRILVDVLATPPEHERTARIAEARSRAEAVRAWNLAHDDDRYGFIAVWGSATPTPEEIEILKRGGVLLALTAPPTIIDAGRT